MKLKEIFNAHQAFEAFLNMHFNSFKVMHDLVKLNKKIKEEVEFFVDSNRNLIMEHSKKKEDGTPDISDSGQIKFDNSEKLKEYMELVRQLEETEINDIEKLTINVSDIKDSAALSPNDLIKLEVFINFEF